MKTLAVMTAALAGAMAGWAGLPSVSSVTVTSPGAGNRTVTVDYALDQTAVVTFDVKTNGVSVGTSAGDVGGEANRVVLAGAGKKIFWTPHRAWPGFSSEAISVEVKAWALDAPPPYLVIDLHARDVRYYADANLIPFGGVTNKTYKDTHLVMRKVPAANVIATLGSTQANASTKEREIMHRVKLSSDFYMAIYELTRGQYGRITGDLYTTRICHPFANVAKVSNLSVFRGASKSQSAEPKASSPLGKLRAYTGLALDLPNAAQWEFACRAGVPGNVNVAGKTLTEVAWTADNWRRDPNLTANGHHEVGLLVPNAFGLYDMQGNAMETTLDALVSGETAWVETFGLSIGTDTDGQPIYGDPPVSTVGSSTTIVCMGGNFDEPETGWNAFPPARKAGGRTIYTTDTAFRLICPVANAGRIVAP